jgi:hypothetical protein
MEDVGSKYVQDGCWNLLLSIIYYAIRVGRGVNSISEVINSCQNASTIATVMIFERLIRDGRMGAADSEQIWSTRFS